MTQKEKQKDEQTEIEGKNKQIESDSGEWQDRPIPSSVFHYLLLERLKGEVKD